MNIGENDDGCNYNCYGFEMGYLLNAALGEGTYRIIYEGGQNAFLNSTGTTIEDRNVVFLSFDQPFGKHLAGWICVGRGDDDAAVNASNLYSGASTWAATCGGVAKRTSVLAVLCSMAGVHPPSGRVSWIGMIF
jgi:hypothetical protein